MEEIAQIQDICSRLNSSSNRCDRTYSPIAKYSRSKGTRSPSNISNSPNSRARRLPNTRPHPADTPSPRNTSSSRDSLSAKRCSRSTNSTRISSLRVKILTTRAYSFELPSSRTIPRCPCTRFRRTYSYQKRTRLESTWWIPIYRISFLILCRSVWSPGDSLCSFRRRTSNPSSMITFGRRIGRICPWTVQWTKATKGRSSQYRSLDFVFSSSFI